MSFRPLRVTRLGQAQEEEEVKLANEKEREKEKTRLRLVREDAKPAEGKEKRRLGVKHQNHFVGNISSSRRAWRGWRRRNIQNNVNVHEAEAIERIRDTDRPFER